MEDLTARGDAGRQYAAAHTAHYGARNLPLALQLYRALFTSHPGSLEAGYARTQVQNIVNAVVPKQTLLESQLAMADVHLAAAAVADG